MDVISSVGSSWQISNLCPPMDTLSPSARPFSTTKISSYYEKGGFDELVEAKGVKILIDPKAMMHVIEIKMDFLDDKLKSEFIFINPNYAGQCGCGESFMKVSSSGAAEQGGRSGTRVIDT